MKKAHLKELQANLLGTVTDNKEVLEHFSTDLSIFQITPEAVVYPRNTADVRKTVQFAAGRAEAGKPSGLIPRGLGTDLGGGAIGEGIQLVFPAHMNKLLRLDRNTVTVQPGILYRTLQQTLHTHGRSLPPYPTSIDYSTIGGAVSNNASGEKSVKYGPTRVFVTRLKVVLSDGSLIETKRISARELNRKKGLHSLEGEIYRKLDNLLIDHADLISKHKIKLSKNTAGYALDKVRGKDGSFDLSQVIIGAQGTLGIITEVTLKTLSFNPRTTLVVGYFDSLNSAASAVGKLSQLSPSALELVSSGLLDYVAQTRPGELAGLLPEDAPRAAVLIQFDDFSQVVQKLRSGRAVRLLGKLGASARVATDPLEQAALWKIRRSAAAVHLASGAKKAVPFIDDAVVPPAKLPAFIDKAHKLLMKYDLDFAVWGEAGDGRLHLQPFLDLSKSKDTGKIFSLSKEYYQLVHALGGSTSGGNNDGLLRALYLKDLYGEEMFELYASAKHIFDPRNILNPGKKTDATEEFLREHLRSEYSVKHLFDHLVYT